MHVKLCGTSKRAISRISTQRRYLCQSIRRMRLPLAPISVCRVPSTSSNMTFERRVCRRSFQIEGFIDALFTRLASCEPFMLLLRATPLHVFQSDEAEDDDTAGPVQKRQRTERTAANNQSQTEESDMLSQSAGFAALEVDPNNTSVGRHRPREGLTLGRYST